MASKNFERINDLSDSPLRKKFVDQVFVPETNIAVGFGRVSIKKNKDKGNSDLAQIENMETYAEKEKLNIVKFWDAAETGSKHERRKKFLEMIDYVRVNPKVKHVLFSHQSRSNRNRESAREIESLVRSGISVHFARDQRKLTCVSDLEAWLLWDVNNILNEKFIKDHTKNVMDGVIKRTEMGLFSGKAPYGYRNFRREDQLSIFVLHEREATWVKAAFQKFATGRYSEQALLRELAVQYPDLERKVDSKRCSEILRNPFYYGEFKYDGQLYRGHPAYHPVLIDFDTFNEVQKVLSRPERSKRKVTEYDHPYIGLVKCGGVVLDKAGKPTSEVCGCAITGEEKRKKLANGDIKRFYYWHCTSTRSCSQKNAEYLAAQGRNRINYTQSEIEILMEAVFAPLKFTSDVCKWMQESLLKEHAEKSTDHKQHLGALRRREEMLRTYMNRAYEDKLQGLIAEDMWREKNETWRLEHAGIVREIQAIDQERDDYIDRGVELIELVQHFETIYKNSSADKKRKMIEIVSSNHVLKNGTIEFDYKKPFGWLAEGRLDEKWWT